MNDLQEKRDNFAFKLSAAKYHLKVINETFKNNKELIVNGEIDLPNTRPFIYHYYSLVYELYSCFDMTLLLINKKYKLKFEDKEIYWGEKTDFRNLLKKNHPDVFFKIQSITQAPWFVALKSTRNCLIHHGIITMQIDYHNSKINIINPIINGKVLHFDMNLWGEEMSNFFNSMYK